MILDEEAAKRTICFPNLGEEAEIKEKEISHILILKRGTSQYRTQRIIEMASTNTHLCLTSLKEDSQILVMCSDGSILIKIYSSLLE